VTPDPDLAAVAARHACHPRQAAGLALALTYLRDAAAVIAWEGRAPSPRRQAVIAARSASYLTGRPSVPVLAPDGSGGSPQARVTPRPWWTFTPAAPAGPVF
jgi:hypothetical protein